MTSGRDRGGPAGPPSPPTTRHEPGDRTEPVADSGRRVTADLRLTDADRSEAQPNGDRGVPADAARSAPSRDRRAQVAGPPASRDSGASASSDEATGPTVPDVGENLAPEAETLPDKASADGNGRASDSKTPETCRESTSRPAEAARDSQPSTNDRVPGVHPSNGAKPAADDSSAAASSAPDSNGSARSGNNGAATSGDNGGSNGAAPAEHGSHTAANGSSNGVTAGAADRGSNAVTADGADRGSNGATADTADRGSGGATVGGATVGGADRGSNATTVDGVNRGSNGGVPASSDSSSSSAAAAAGRGANGSAPAGSGGSSNGDAPNEVDAAINALWREFRAGPNQRLRERLVLHYAPLVKYVAGRVGTGLPTHIDVGDLVQSGIFGLIDAIEKFDPERGWRFETYAMQRIRGAILDDLRSQDWVPRVVRSRLREAERALERLGAQLHRTPTDTELAEELDISVEELRDLYGQLRLTSVVALEDLVAAGKDSGSLVDTLPDDDAVDPVAVLVDRDNRRQLAEAIAQLTERDRIVVSLYYFESLTLAEIGKVLGVTESRVSQLHTRAVLRLRAHLTS